MDDLDTLQPAPAAGEVNPMEALLADSMVFRQLHSGDIVDGTIVNVSPQEILVDIGYKSDALVDNRELERLDKDYLATLSAGEPVVAYVLQPEDKDGNVVISLLRAQQEQDWRQADELLKSQEVFEGIVTGYNRGGVIVRVGRVRGFVPASQLSDRWHAQQDDGGDPEQRWTRLTGQTMQLKVVELDRRRNRLILSERAAMRDWRKTRKDRLLSELHPGDVLKGVVTSIAPFGAFVDLGGADGLIHLSELAWHRVEHPSEVVQVGQEVQVFVLNIDEERKRIGLSLRRLTPEPWTTVGRDVHRGPGRGCRHHQADQLRGLCQDRRLHRGPDPHLRAGRSSCCSSQGSGRRGPGGGGADHPHRPAAPARRPEHAPELGRWVRRI